MSGAISLREGMILDDAEAPAERPRLRRGEGQPGDPEAERGRRGGQVHMPEVVRLPSGDDARRQTHTRRLASRRSISAQHSVDGRGGEVKTGTRKDLRDLDLPHPWTEDLEAPDNVADELGEPVHRLVQRKESMGPLLVEARGPGGDGEGGDQEGPGGLSEGPGSRGPQFQDGEALGRGIVGPFLGFEVLHAGVLDADRLAQEPNLLLQAVQFRPSAERGVQAAGDPAPGGSQGSPGERNQR